MELLTSRDHVLVAFDGPVASLPDMSSTADRLRILVASGGLPRKVARTDDPFVILAHAATIGPATERAVYAQLCRIEHEIVSNALVVPGVQDMFARITAAGTQITVVTSLDITAVRSFLLLHDFSGHVVGRTGPDRAVLPPAPDLISLAIHTRAIPPELCAFVGSTPADLAAARAAGVQTIRFPGEWSEWFAPLSVEQRDPQWRDRMHH